MRDSLKVAFIGGARYGKPLGPTLKKKFRLLSEHFDVYVIGFALSLRPRRFSEAANFYLLPQLPLPVLRYALMTAAGAALACWLIARHQVRTLVAQSPYEGVAAALSKQIAKLWGKRVILVIESHGQFEEDLFAERSIRWPRLYRWVMHIGSTYSLKHADVLRVISTSTRQQVERRAPDKEIHQFPTWTDIEVFERASENSARINDSAEVLYAGVLIPRKGVHHLINAFARVVAYSEDARLRLVGQPKNRNYTRKLQAMTETPELDGRVEFLGQLPQSELADEMRRASIFVLPSLSEGLGRVVIEAMATGTPVIASKVGGIPDLVIEGVTGFLIPPGDEVALANRIRVVLDDPSLAGEMGKSARTYAHDHFSEKAYIQGYRRLLSSAYSKIDK